MKISENIKVNKYKLSIVVPTKDRYKYLQHLIDYFTLQNQDLIELVIEDNTLDNSEILYKINSLSSNANIKYFHSDESRTITMNSDAAIMHSSGDYVLYLGDDDCFLPNILEAVELMDKTSSEALVSLRPDYGWPDVKNSIHWKVLYPHTFRLGTGEYFNVDIDQELKYLLKNGIMDLGKLPRVYHGIVKRTLLDQIYSQYGSFFPGASPDMANAVALALLSPKTVYIDYPFIIAGTGGARVKGNEKGDLQLNLERLSFIQRLYIDEWDINIPKIWTLQTIYPVTALHVIKSSSFSSYYSDLIDYNSIYKSFIKNHPRYAIFFIRSLSGKSLVKFLLSLPHFIYKKLVHEVSNTYSDNTICRLNDDIATVNQYVSYLYDKVKTVTFRPMNK